MKHPYNNAISSQQARLIKHFKSTPRLTTFEARQKLGIVHPGGRIMELRRKGYLIDTYRTTEADVNGVPHRIGLYVYRGKEADDEQD